MHDRYFIALGGILLLVAGGIIGYNLQEIRQLETEAESGGFYAVSDEPIEMDLDSLAEAELITYSEEPSEEPVEESESTSSYVVPVSYTKPVNPPPSQGGDGGGFDEPQIVDQDKDGIADGLDNCMGRHNPTQVDSDGDGFGNECDTTPYGEGNLDTDADGVTDESDNCPNVYNPEQDAC